MSTLLAPFSVVQVSLFDKILGDLYIHESCILPETSYGFSVFPIRQDKRYTVLRHRAKTSQPTMGLREFTRLFERPFKALWSEFWMASPDDLLRTLTWAENRRPPVAVD